MKKTAIIIMLIFASALQASASDNGIRRYLLAAGANNGGAGRVTLRYAVSDAQAFAAVLTDLGGVEKNNALVLTNPTGKELLGGLENLGKLLAKENNGGARSEAFIYYSGHADVNGLKLGGETVSWAEFRNAVNGLGADVKIAVLDACGSGMIARTKGGSQYPVFLTDASSSMKGYAFLTSSNGTEMSQEGDHIRSGYFTYALLGGLRGAADLSGDGKVTINEAYQYAFNETLHNTQNSMAGTQHPSRDMNLVGTGDVVMTDLRGTGATLLIDAAIEGRFFIRDAGGILFTEFGKAQGKAVELGIPRGKYSVQLQTPSNAWLARDMEVSDGKKTTLALSDMKAVKARAATARGNGAGDETMASRLRDILGKGIYDAALYADACGDFGVSLRAGASWLYGSFEYRQPYGGWGEWPKTWGVGIGSRFDISDKFFVDFGAAWAWAHYYTEGYSRKDTTGWVTDTTPNSSNALIPKIDVVHVESSFSSADGLASVRFGMNYRLKPYMSVGGGVSVNALFEEIYGVKAGLNQRTFGTGTLWHDYKLKINDDDEHNMRLWLSFYVGVTFGIPTSPNRYSSSTLKE